MYIKEALVWFAGKLLEDPALQLPGVHQGRYQTIHFLKFTSIDQSVHKKFFKKIMVNKIRHL